MRILITGAAGFVGRHMMHHFIQQGQEVIGIDNYLPGGGSILPYNWMSSIKIDPDKTYIHEIDCIRFFENNNTTHFDLVLHLAAVVGGRQTIEKSPLSVATDLAIDAAMWKWAAKVRPGRVVYFSSSAAYPISTQTLKLQHQLIESDLDVGCRIYGIPDNTYGWAKMTGEYLGNVASVIHDVDYVVYRPFSGYGEDQGSEYPMSAIVNRALAVPADKFDIDVWGSGKQVRDWIHIDDIVNIVNDSCMLLPSGAVMNLSSGIGTNMDLLATTTLAMVRNDPYMVFDVKHMTSMPEGVMYRVGNTNFRKLFYNKPLITLEQGIERMINHFKSENV
jgi:nucleoside-diphosphate-sugar epimerase